jgi:hypothetical protein
MRGVSNKTLSPKIDKSFLCCNVKREPAGMILADPLTDNASIGFSILAIVADRKATNA